MGGLFPRHGCRCQVEYSWCSSQRRSDQVHLDTRSVVQSLVALQRLKLIIQSMPDRLSPEARSEHMRHIRGRDTRPEIRVRQMLHRMGYRFRLHRHDLPGSPDIVLPRLKTAIFVHGCFWHQHPGCRLARLPKSRLDYWLPKLKRNAMRDAAALIGTDKIGWRALVIWECETAEVEVLRGCLSPLSA